MTPEITDAILHIRWIALSIAIGVFLIVIKIK
jgi:hypothetical protein